MTKSAFLTICFKIITDSQEVAKLVQRSLFTQFPPEDTSYKIKEVAEIVQRSLCSLSFLQWIHLTKLEYNIRSRKLTLGQSV